MTVAIKTAKGDLVWFDAVLSFGESYITQLSSHPIETGAVITDHAITKNNGYSITGVISDADFNVTIPKITSEDSTKFKVDRIDFGDKRRTDAVEIDANSPNKLLGYLPEGISSALGATGIPNVVLVENTRPDLILVKEAIKTIQKEATLVDVISFDGDKILEVMLGCLITNASFSEDPDTGESLHAALSLEQVVFVTLDHTQVDKQTWNEISTSAVKKKKKGTVDGKASEAAGQAAKNGTEQPQMSLGNCLANGGALFTCLDASDMSFSDAFGG